MSDHAMSDPGNSTTPAGWYPDPHGLPQQRWWNGHHWTVNVAPTPEPALHPGPTPLSSLPGPRRSTAAAYAASSVGADGQKRSALAPNAFELAATATETTAFPTRRQLREQRPDATVPAAAQAHSSSLPSSSAPSSSAPSTHSYAATHSYAPQVNPSPAPAYASASAQPQARPYAPAPFAEPEPQFAPRSFAPPQFAPAETAASPQTAFPTTLAQAGPPVMSPPIAVTGTAVRGAISATAAAPSSFAPPVAAPAPAATAPAASEPPTSIPGWHPAPSTTGDLALREPLRALGSPEATALAAAPVAAPAQNAPAQNAPTQAAPAPTALHQTAPHQTAPPQTALTPTALTPTALTQTAPATRTAPTQGHAGTATAPRPATVAPTSIPQHFLTPVSAAPAADSPQRLFEMPAASSARSGSESSTANQAYQPFGMVSRTKAGTVTKPTLVNTLSVWIIAITPLLMAGVAVGVVSYLAEFYTLFMQGGLVVIFAVATIAFAIRDQRELSAAGHLRTASPAWLLLTPLAYLISRTVEVKRQSGYAGGALLVWLLAVGAVVGAGFLFPEWITKIAVATGHF